MVVKRLLFLILPLLLVACDKDNNTPQPASSWDIAVLNEGQMGSNNASISTYRQENGTWTATPYQFEAANDQPLGDLLNSYAYDSIGALYLVMDNSKRIYKVNPTDWTLQATLDFPQGANPRNLVIAPGGKGYVTSLYEAKVYVLDMNAFSLIGEIAVQDFPDQLVLHAGKLYVSCADISLQQRNNRLAVIDPAADSLIRYIELPTYNPGTLTPLSGGQLLVECRGTFYTDETAAFYWLDPTSDAIVDSVVLGGSTFASTAVGDNAAYFVLGDALDESQQHIARLDLATKTIAPQYLSNAALGLGQFEYPYALEYHNGALYIGVSAGTLDGYLLKATLTDPPVIEMIGTAGQFPGEVLLNN